MEHLYMRVIFGDISIEISTLRIILIHCCNITNMFVVPTKHCF